MAIPTFNAGQILKASELNAALEAFTETANTFSEPQTFEGAIMQVPGAGVNNETPFAQYGDLFSDAIMAGLTTATSSTLSGTLAAGDAYVIGQRVVYPGGNYTVAASSTSYLDLSNTGVLTVSTSATVTANSLRLWTVTSSATAITGVTQIAPSGAVANAPVSGPAGESGNQFINYTQLVNGQVLIPLTFNQIQAGVGYTLGAGAFANGYIWGGSFPSGTIVPLPSKNGYIFQFVNNTPAQQAQLPENQTATAGSAIFTIGLIEANPTAPQQLMAPSGGSFILPGSPTVMDFHQLSEYAELFCNGNNSYGIIGGTWSVFNLVNSFYALQTFTKGIAPSASFTSNSATLTGTTAGTIVSSMPEQGVYKKFAAYASGYENDTTTAQTITFPTAFANPPAITTNTTDLSLSVSTTGLTINAPNNTTTYTGLIIVEGF